MLLIFEILFCLFLKAFFFLFDLFNNILKKERKRKVTKILTKHTINVDLENT